MDIKIFAGKKEVISPDFVIDIDQENKILNLCIKNWHIDEQSDFLSLLDILINENIVINPNYIAINVERNIYLFSLSKYKDYKFENLLTSGYYSLMFAFVDQNDMIISNEYYVIKLDGHQFTELQ